MKRLVGRLVGLVLVLGLLLASFPGVVGAETGEGPLKTTVEMYRDYGKVTIDVSGLPHSPGTTVVYWLYFYSRAPGEELRPWEWWGGYPLGWEWGDWEGKPVPSPKFSVEKRWPAVNDDQEIKWRLMVYCWWFSSDGRYQSVQYEVGGSAGMAVNLPFRYPKPEPPTQAPPSSYVEVHVMKRGGGDINGATVWLGWVDGQGNFNPIPGIPPQFTVQTAQTERWGFGGFASFHLQETRWREGVPYAVKVQYFAGGLFHEKTTVVRVFPGRTSQVDVIFR